MSHDEPVCRSAMPSPPGSKSGVAIGFLRARHLHRPRPLGRHALACSLAGFGMLIVQSFGGERFHVGGFAIGWLFAVALVIGLGLGPVLSH